jgi:hypothetical protein
LQHKRRVLLAFTVVRPSATHIIRVSTFFFVVVTAATAKCVVGVLSLAARQHAASVL